MSERRIPASRGPKYLRMPGPKHNSYGTVLRDERGRRFAVRSIQNKIKPWPFTGLGGSKGASSYNHQLQTLGFETHWLRGVARKILSPTDIHRFVQRNLQFSGGFRYDRIARVRPSKPKSVCVGRLIRRAGYAGEKMGKGRSKGRHWQKLRPRNL